MFFSWVRTPASRWPLDWRHSCFCNTNAEREFDKSRIAAERHEIVKATFHYCSQLQTWLQTWFSTKFAARFSASSCGFATCFRHGFDLFCRKPGREPAAIISTCRDWCSRIAAGSLVHARARQMECRKKQTVSSQPTNLLKLDFRFLFVLIVT